MYEWEGRVSDELKLTRADVAEELRVKQLEEVKRNHEKTFKEKDKVITDAVSY